MKLDWLNAYFADRAKGDVEVVAIGKLRSQSGRRWYRTIQRPLRIGCSIGHYAVGAGSLGCFVVPNDGPETADFLLSNNHILANCNEAVPGDAIYQPGRLDAGRDGLSEAARLRHFIPLRSDAQNEADCAYAEVNQPIHALKSFMGADRVLRGLGSVYEAGRAYKFGRTTGLTEGQLTALEVDEISVDMPTGRHRFVNQIELSGVTSPFSKPGDSGSVVFDDNGMAFGLVFAGTEAGGRFKQGVTYANPLDRVLDLLNVRLVV